MMDKNTTVMSVKSGMSKASLMSQATIEAVTQSSQLKLQTMQTSLNEETILESWAAFGMHISKSLRQGRAVSVPKLGLFTFSGKDVDMEGTTNEFQRDKDNREAVFIIAKEFAKGSDIKAAVYRAGGILRPLVLSSTSGRIQQSLCSYQDISNISGVSKENAQYSVERIIRRLEDQVRQSSSETVSMQIPSVGLFMCRKGLACVKYEEFINREIKGLLKLSVDARRVKNKSELTKTRLKELTQSMTLETTSRIGGDKQLLGMDQFQMNSTIDQQAQDYLEQQLQIDRNLNQIPESQEQTLPVVSQNNNTTNVDDDAAFVAQLNTALSKDKSALQPLLTANQYQPSSSSQEPLTTQNSQAFEKLKYLLRYRNTKPYDFFSRMMGYIYGPNSTDRRTLDRTQLTKAFNKFEIDMETDEEFEQLFVHLDSKKDGKLDLEEWNAAFNLKFVDDLFRTMGVSREAEFVSFEEFKNGLYKINITKHQADQISSAIFSGKAQLPISVIIDSLTTNRYFNYKGTANLPPDQDDKSTSLLLQIYRKIKKQLQALHPEETSDKHDKYLIAEFEKLDAQSQGILDVANFKTCLIKANLNLNLNEVVRIARYIEKTSKGQIDYCKFSKKVNNSFKMSDEIEQLPHLAEEIKKYLKANRITGEQLIVQLVEESRKKSSNKVLDSKRVRISAFAELLCERISFLIKKNDVIINCEFIDIDKDGFIDQHDLNTFLSRYSFFEHNNQERTSTAPNTSRSSGQFHFRPATIATVSSNKLSSFEAAKESLINSQVRLYPTDPLSLDKLQVILSDLKRNTHLRRLSFYDIFKTLDSNNDGFVNFSEFEENINSFIQLSSHAKEGLFAFLDHLKIGMFDFPRLASVLSRITINESQEPQQRESWSWEEGILEEMRKWKKTNGLTDQEAFRVADSDFDGFVSKEDLKVFIVKTLKNFGNQIQSSSGDSNIHIDRLYQLIDVYKKGYIQPHDFAQIFQSKEEEKLKDSSAQLPDSQLGFKGITPSTLNFTKLKTRTADGRSRNQMPKMVPQLSNGFPANSSSIFGVNKSITSKSIQQLPNKSAYFSSEIQPGSSTVRGDEQKQLFPSKNISGSQFTAFLKPKSTVHFGNTLDVEKWMVNCCQQIALRVSQNFKDLFESFEIISNHSSKIEYHKFSDWISSGNVLHGFNLTDNFLQQLFAFMDPHKKGYLTEQDWISALEIFIESSQTPISDLHDIVKFSFSSPKEAFKFFMFGEKDKSDSTTSTGNTKNNNFLRNSVSASTDEGVSFKKFKFSLDSLFKQVYPESTVKAIWNSLHSQLKSNLETPLTLAHFEYLFNSEFKEKKPLGALKKRAQSQQKQLRVANIEKLRTSEQFKSSCISQTSLLSGNPFSLHDDVINKFKYLLLSKGVNLQSILQKNDVNSTGFVSTQQLKNIIMSLNIGVSSKDIDYLMVFADPQNVAKINYKNFLQKLAFNNSQQSLINRSKKRLQNLKHFLYSYLISPKDAFKEFDEARKGVMTLEDFRYFLVKMSKLEQSDVPSYSISKDMFDQIDLKHDGLIDLEEWLQAFMDYGQSDDVLNIEKEKESSRLAFAKYHRTKLDFIDHSKKNNKNNNNNSNLRLPTTTSDSTNGSQTLIPLSKNGNLTVDDIARNSSTVPLTWERSQQYDEALFLIARNRRYLIEQFDKLFEDTKSKGLNQVHEKCLLPMQVNQVFRDFLATHKIFTTDENLAVLYNFAVKRGEINYVYLIDIFKSRLDLKHNPPKRVV